MASVADRRAARAQRAVRASRTEIGVALGGHRDDVTGRTGDGCAVLVDDEVVALEAARNRARARVGFDGALMTAAFERRQGLARAVSGVGENLETGLLILQQFDARGSVGEVRGGESGTGDQTGFGLDHQVSLETVAVDTARLVHVTRLVVNDPDHAVLRYCAHDAPVTLVVQFDVLARHEREQRRRGNALVILHVPTRVEQTQRVADQRVHELGAGEIVIPGD